MVIGAFMKRGALATTLLASCALWGGYVTDGLVLHYDAIDNAGTGEHEDNPEKWVDLTRSGADLDLTSEKIKVGADYIAFNKVKKSVAGVKDLASDTSTEYTLEVVARTDESFKSGYFWDLVKSDKIGLFFHRAKDLGGLIGTVRRVGNQLRYMTIPDYCGDWNNIPFLLFFSKIK